MSIIWFIVIIVVLILVHEIGHFLAAKLSGIRVDEFGIGFPPRIWGKKFGETIYSINWIPFGGFVKIFGESPDSESIEGPDNKRSFVNKPKWIQAIVLVAGVTFNVIFAWLLISVGFMSGMPTPVDYASAGEVEDAKLTITIVQPESPAEEAGIQSGDVITALRAGENTLGEITPSGVSSFVEANGESDLVVSYIRGEEVGEVVVSPAGGFIEGKKAIGISMDMIGTLTLSPIGALIEGAKTTYNLTGLVAVGLWDFISASFTGQANLNQVSGPVGIVGLVGDASALGFVYLLSFTAIISIHLAIINLVPFPALDGGRLLFVLIEKIKGSPISPKVANMANGVGFVILILLMVVITFSDIAKLL